jgi:hypothetical protein
LVVVAILEREGKMSIVAKNPLAVRESRFVRLLYSHAARALVAEFEREHQRSLYIRHAATHDYERLVTPDDQTSFTSPVVSRSVPFVFFNVMSVSARGSSNWLHVARANIVTREIDVVLPASELDNITNADPRCPIRPWVSDLFDVSDDGTLLTCRVGRPGPIDNGAIHMKYAIVQIDLAARTLGHLADLEQTPKW